jgi:hypothetical protein
MLTLPKPYADELLYSILVRYYIRSGYRKVKEAQVKLFDTLPQQPWDILLPSNLKRLTRKLWTKANYTPDYFIQGHTLYPFYAQFLIPVETELLRQVMVQQGRASIPTIAKIPLNVEKAYHSYLKFCPQCFEQESEGLGEAYWHRTHQIPGIVLCPDHEVPLLNSTVCLNSKALHYIAADSDTCPISNNVPSYTDLTKHRMTAYTESLERLLNRQIPFRGLAWLRKRYHHYAAQKGFLKFDTATNFTFDETKFFEELCDFYGEEFLDNILPVSFQASKQQFIQCLLACDLEQTIDRVRHILLINFLSDSLQDFFAY